ncbi:hypothetical protein KDK95_06860 [Actinospica sp. MGRD01-02]|uniref:Uncharacterized protein n=1 Tax=Actinospica acidithermotolerans TaxID=2828514 RepID=A0A941IF76_9ACTN|nr:hypothetical protein [Actinospica acidithermotolerans]MBR7826020.1 hypothetical protein [Actinospica acidithermotolerans]
MRYILPIALFACLAALIAISPHIEPRRLRRRAARVTGQLRAEHGFRDGSRASWSETRSTGWPPFHYGKHRELDNLLLGTVYDLPVRVAGYEVVFNGSWHRYGLAVIVLPSPAEWLEVRGQRPFTSARVPEHVPDGQLALGVPEFDAAWSVYAESPEAQRAAAGSAALAQAMLDAPTPFSWRVHDGEVLLWRRDGWSDAAQLLACIGCVANLLGLADTYPVG